MALLFWPHLPAGLIQRPSMVLVAAVGPPAGPRLSNHCPVTDLAQRPPGPPPPRAGVLLSELEPERTERRVHGNPFLCTHNSQRDCFDHLVRRGFPAEHGMLSCRFSHRSNSKNTSRFGRTFKSWPKMLLILGQRGINQSSYKIVLQRESGWHYFSLYTQKKTLKRTSTDVYAAFLHLGSFFEPFGDINSV